MFNGEIISYNISKRPNLEQVYDMLDKAFTSLDELDGLILHSDQGWQYQHCGYRKRLKEHGIIQSMSRKGNCLDNAAMESFFGTLKSECFHGHEFASIDELEQTVKEYIHYYNHDRIKVKLKGLSPVQYRKQALLAA